MTAETHTEALRRAREALAAREHELSAVVDLAPIILFACDATGRCTLARGAGLELVGVDGNDLTETRIFDVLAERPDVARLFREALAGEPARAVLPLGDHVFDLALRPQLGPDGAVTGVIGVAHDVSEAQRSQDQVLHLAYHDPLTGLANRARLEQGLADALARARRSGEALGLLYIDLDGFKLVNDTLGHAAGDELLCEVAQRLSSASRASDLLARHGGDEFMLLLEGLPVEAVHAAEAIASKLLESLARPFVIAGAELALGASIGISVWPQHGQFPADLLQHADAALYHAKARGRGVYATYDPATGSARRKLTLTARLRHALARDEFELHYQPIFDLSSGRRLAMEALVRWNDPARGIVLPGEFVAVAEGSGLIDELGAWVLEEACRQMRAWLDEGLDPLVSVNVAPRQLRDVGLARRVGVSLDTYGLEGRRLMVELTESAAMREPARTDPLLAELSNLGVRLGIDDFGTGHSSLSRLKALPFDAVKLDRRFLLGIPGAPVEQRVFEAVLGLARALDLVVVAEGIETGPQLDFLRGAGCHLGQGYLLGRPQPAPRMAALMRADAAV